MTPDLVIDLHTGDTHFDIAPAQLFETISGVLLLLCGIHWWCRRFLLSLLLTWAHTVLTILMAEELVRLCLVHITWQQGNTSRLWSTFVLNNPEMNAYIEAVFNLGIGSQLLFLANLAGGLIRAKRKGRERIPQQE
ncbi:MAG TPA: hypothetical protein VHK69_12085 [Chitinophagaceae bacterium]|nr:hypothetical protein [Chitinophagaceae bacterium]